jgi:hypothetical protein
MRHTHLVGLLALAGAAHAASADVIIVDARSAIFDAGRPAPTLDGLLPVEVAVPENAASMHLNEVFGLVRAHPVLQWGGPDGNTTTLNDTDIDSYLGVSGLTHPRTLPLLAVFLDGDEPEGPAPARLDFHAIGSNFASLSPVLGQSFFVGDGWTDGGTQQQFEVPAGATRVFFGFADAGFFTGEPGAYIDNEGAITGEVGFTMIPAPGSLALLGLGVLSAARRRR